MAKTARGRLTWIILPAAGVVVLVVIALCVVPLVRHRSQNVSQGNRWAGLLKDHPSFSAQPAEVTFSYAAPEDENLQKLRVTYDLDRVAGGGPEIERLINLARWVYHLTGHANEPTIPEQLNASSLIPLARDGQITMNCYMKTIVLNEVYLAMGFESRQTHLLPAEQEDEESHFVTSVYSRTLRRWLLMDPDLGAYVTDRQGSPLGVAEIRRGLVAGRPLVVLSLDPPPSFLVQAWSDVRDYIDGTSYLWYLGKNIFKVRCAQDSQFDQVARPHRLMYELMPGGYREELLRAPRITASGNKIVFITDEAGFWQKPDGG
ncbi:MAG: hypothetical protein KBD01_09015 [Acidobacteria bacterium]|nr:hypothetical protein [Acidobacteriota bacterium]